MTTPLQKAAQAVISRRDSPLWKDQPHTANYIAELRKALDAEIVQSVEPVLYQRRMKPDYGFNWTAWDDCSEATFKQVLTVPNLHGWTHQARALYLHPPQPQATAPVPDLLKEFKNVMSWIDNWSPEFSYDPDWPDDRDKARSAIAAAQGEKP